MGCWELHYDKMVHDIFSVDKKETEMSDCVTGENTYICRMAAFLARPIIDLCAVVGLDLHIQ